MRDTSTQVIEAKPLPKNATVRKNTTQPGSDTKFAPTTQVDRSIPPMTGPFLATDAGTPRRTSRSEKRPPATTPQNAAKNGSDEKSPCLMKSRCLYVTRYVGNHVRKNQGTALSANWPM